MSSTSCSDHFLILCRRPQNLLMSSWSESFKCCLTNSRQAAAELLYNKIWLMESYWVRFSRWGPSDSDFPDQGSFCLVTLILVLQVPDLFLWGQCSPGTLRALEIVSYPGADLLLVWRPTKSSLDLVFDMRCCKIFPSELWSVQLVTGELISGRITRNRMQLFRGFRCLVQGQLRLDHKHPRKWGISVFDFL